MKESLQRLWNEHRTKIMRFATIVMGMIAASWILANLVMLFGEFRWGAMDFHMRYKEVCIWFTGDPVYAIYPPASYAILWPFQGWLSVTPAKVVWAGIMLSALAWLVYLLVRESGANTSRERQFVAFMLLSLDAVGFDIGHGQFPIVTMSALVTGILIICHGRKRWQDDLLGATIFLLALIKPTVSAPFFWLVVFIPGRLRPAVFVVSGYVALTLFASPFQGDLIEVFQEWIETASGASAYGAKTGGYGNVHSSLAIFELHSLNHHISISVLLLLGVWVFRGRQSDLWVLLGVSAFASRFWVYHRSYDDVLILLPMIALFRIAKGTLYGNKPNALAGSLLALLIVMSMASSTKLILPESESIVKFMRTLVFLAVFVFLVYWERCERKSTKSRLTDVETDRA